MKKTALVISFALALFISAVAEEELVSLAGANPGVGPRYFGTEYTGSPFIVLDSPLNKTYVGNVSMSFTVMASIEWLSTPLPGSKLVSELHSVDYYIDGSFKGSIVADSNLSSPFHYSASLTGLQEGRHNLTVKTNSIGVKADWDDREWIYTRVYNVPAQSASVTRQFNVGAEYLANPVQTVLIMAASTVCIALVGAGFLVYFKKRKH